ncbi:AraC family transcriptional regulator [Neolewinella agarilytica]|nr:AraC family transcriptional regulator [Neolewinella agarilytica]
MPGFNVTHLRTRPLEAMVENRTTFTMKSLAISLFETHEEAKAVNLHCDTPVLASMVQGRKVMSLGGEPGFNFLPGESIMMPPEELMTIDFPDADQKEPTKCLALEIDPDEIQKVSDLLNEHQVRTGGRQWVRGNKSFYFRNDAGLTQLIQRLVFLCGEDHPSKDKFVDLSLRELLLRLLESETRYQELLDSQRRASSEPISKSVMYILNNLDKRLTVDQLSRLAHMSSSGFHRVFKGEMGVSPVEFINEERVKLGASLLRQGDYSIQEIALRCGFNSGSYFTRIFRRYYGVKPTEFIGGESIISKV